MSSAQIIRLNLKDFKKIAEQQVDETVDVEPMESFVAQDTPKPEFINLTDMDLDSIKKEAFEQGFQKAKAEAQIEFDAKLAANQDQLALIESRFAETHSMLSKELSVIEDEAARLAYKLVNKLIYEESGLLEKRIKGFFDLVFQRLRDQGKIVIKMKPETFANYGKIIQDLAAKHQLPVETVSNEDADQNIVVDWQHGHLEFVTIPQELDK